MSTEIQVGASDIAKKKEKKDSSVKKRKREVETAQHAEPEPSKPVVKKSKKAHGVSEDAHKRPVTEAISEVGETATAPDSKKLKQKRRDLGISGAEGSDASPPALSTKERKQKKKGTAQELAHTSPNGLEEKTTTPIFDDDELQSHSPFLQQTTSFYVALSPCNNDLALEGVCAEHISPLLLTYHPPLRGIVLSYANARISEHPENRLRANSSSNGVKTVLARSMDEYAVTYVWLTADFMIFRPQRGTYLEGYVNLQNEGLLGLVCHNYFNAGIERSRLPKDWRWDDGEDAEGKCMEKEGQQADGYYVDGRGAKVEGRLIFRVRDFEASPGTETGAGSINIFGTLLLPEEDERIDEDERHRSLVR